MYGVSLPEFRMQKQLVQAAESTKKAMELYNLGESHIDAVKESAIFNEFEDYDVSLEDWIKQVIAKIDSSTVKKPSARVLEIPKHQKEKSVTLREAMQRAFKTLNLIHITHDAIAVSAASKILWLIFLLQDIQIELSESEQVMLAHRSQVIGQLKADVSSYVLGLVRPAEPQNKENHPVIIQSERKRREHKAPQDTSQPDSALAQEAAAFGFTSVDEYLQAKHMAEVSQLVSSIQLREEKHKHRQVSPVTDENMAHIAEAYGLSLERFKLDESEEETDEEVEKEAVEKIDGGDLSQYFRNAGRPREPVYSMTQSLQPPRPETPTPEHAENKECSLLTGNGNGLSLSSLAITRPSEVGVFAMSPPGRMQSPTPGLASIPEDRVLPEELISLPQTTSIRRLSSSPLAGPVADIDSEFYAIPSPLSR